MAIVKRKVSLYLMVLAGGVLVLFLAAQSPRAEAAELSLLDMVKLSEAVYRVAKKEDYRKIAPKDFKLLKSYKDSTGVFASLFEQQKTGKVVLAYAGTEFSDPRDLLADMGIAKKEVKKALGYLVDSIIDDAKIKPKSARKAAKELMRKVMKVGKKAKKSKARKALDKGPKSSKKLNRQVAAALSILDGLAKVKKTNGKPIRISEVEVTGHSLGGFLVQVVAVKRKIKRAVTFNPPGASEYLKGAKAPRYLTNHSRKGDIVGRLGKHAGDLYLYKNVKFKWKRIKQAYIGQNHKIKGFIEDLGKGMKGKKQ